VARKGRARRFREARELKQGFDDGLFEEKPSASLADVAEGEEGWKTLEDDNSDNNDSGERVTDTTDEDYDPLMD
jgi:hypothetical protein